MVNEDRNEVVVREGAFFYAEEIKCDIQIVRSPMRYGSGGWEDLSEIQDDLLQDTYFIRYGSTTERGVFNARSGSYASLAEAISAAELMPNIGETVRWI